MIHKPSAEYVYSGVQHSRPVNTRVSHEPYSQAERKEDQGSRAAWRRDEILSSAIYGVRPTMVHGPGSRAQLNALARSLAARQLTVSFRFDVVTVPHSAFLSVHRAPRDRSVSVLLRSRLACPFTRFLARAQPPDSSPAHARAPLIPRTPIRSPVTALTRSRRITRQVCNGPPKKTDRALSS